MLKTNTITQIATKQFKWAALSEVVQRFASPIVTVILARLLAPEAFGLVSTAAICIAFAQMFWDAGLSKAIIQTNESPNQAANVVFWCNGVLGVLIYVLLFFTAPAIAVFFKTPMTVPVLRIVGIQIIVASLSSVQRALCIRNLKFKNLLWVQLFSALMPGFVSVPMALAGQGVWALVAGALAGQTLATILLWWFSDWRPSLSFDRKMAAKMFSFAMWVQAESLGAWLMMYGDSIIVGRFMGMEDLGVYRTGWTIIGILYGIILNPFIQLILPTFARLQSDNAAIMRGFYKATKLVLAIVLPMGVGMFFCGQDAASLIFGKKWIGIGFVIQIIGFGQAISWITGINADIYRAVGKPQVNTFMMFTQLFLYLPIYYIAAKYGLRVFVISRTLLTFLALIMNLYICHRVMAVPFNYIITVGKSIIAATALMVLSLYGFNSLFQMEVFSSFTLTFSLFLKITIGLSAYIISLLLLDRRFVSETMNLSKSVIM